MELIVNDNEKDVVRPMSDMSAMKSVDSVDEKDAVRPKRDMDAVRSVDNANEEDEIRPKCDVYAKSVVDEAASGAATSKQERDANGKAAAAKMISEEIAESTNEDVTIRRLIEERRKIARGEKQQVKEVSKQIKKVHQKQEKLKKTRKDTTDS